MYQTVKQLCASLDLSLNLFSIPTDLEKVLHETSGKYCVGDEVRTFGHLLLSAFLFFSLKLES